MAHFPQKIMGKSSRNMPEKIPREHFIQFFAKDGQTEDDQI